MEYNINYMCRLEDILEASKSGRKELNMGFDKDDFDEFSRYISDNFNAYVSWNETSVKSYGVDYILDIETITLYQQDFLKSIEDHLEEYNIKRNRGDFVVKNDKINFRIVKNE